MASGKRKKKYTRRKKGKDRSARSYQDFPMCEVCTETVSTGELLDGEGWAMARVCGPCGEAELLRDDKDKTEDPLRKFISNRVHHLTEVHLPPGQIPGVLMLLATRGYVEIKGRPKAGKKEFVKKLSTKRKGCIEIRFYEKCTEGTGGQR